MGTTNTFSITLVTKIVLENPTAYHFKKLLQKMFVSVDNQEQIGNKFPYICTI